MTVLQIGSFAILFKWVVLGIALLTGLVVLKLWLKRNTTKEINKKLFNIITNSLFFGFFIWKVSLLVLEPNLVMKSPLSLLYFTGGTKGLFIAIVFTFLYLIFFFQKEKLSKDLISQSLLLFSFTTILVFYILSVNLLEKSQTHHTLYIILLFILAYFLVVKIFPSRRWIEIIKNIFILVFIVGLVIWVVYDTKFSEATNDKNVEDIASEIVETGIREGNKAPDFELKTLDDKTVKLSDFVGKKVILNFWATWCPPCKAEMPHMQSFYEEGNVEIIAVNLTTAEKTVKDVSPFVEEYGLTFPILLDEDGDTGQTYQAFTIPTSYIIDTNGIIRKKIVGPMDKEMMEELINSVK